MGKTKEKGTGDSGPVAGDAPSNVVHVPAVPPSLTLSARNRFDIDALVLVVNLAEERDTDRLEDLQFKLREFELYEEAHRGDEPEPAQGT